MKNNPWESIEDAYTPMFLDIVEVSGVRKDNATFRTSVSACVFPPERVDPFSDVELESELMRMSVFILKDGKDAWSMSFRPQVGDQVVLQDGTQWKISVVKDTQDWFEITVRSKA